MQVTFVASHHQEMNRITKRRWQTIHQLAFAFLNKANKVQMAFFNFGLEHAWKMVAAPPIQTLLLHKWPASPANVSLKGSQEFKFFGLRSALFKSPLE